jgi:uracil-DNA glycosylase family 4
MTAPAPPTILPESAPSPRYDAGCRRCARLAEFLDEVSAAHPSYWCKPVPAFGDPDARLVVVGLAPGMHGANATGRPFTGDYAGILLYETLHAFGFASAPVAVSRDDGLTLSNCRINNAVKCLPPGNKPLPVEMRNCNDYLAADLCRLAAGSVVLALGRIAHDAALRSLGLRPSGFRFAHGARHALPAPAPDIVMFDSYHCSRYNTNTGRLTRPMFRDVFGAIASQLGSRASTGLPGDARGRAS